MRFDLIILYRGYNNKYIYTLSVNIFKELLNQARSELYPDCSEFSSLNFLVKLMHVKIQNEEFDIKNINVG